MVRAPARCAARVAVARQSVIRDGPRTHRPAAAAADARPRLTGGSPIACAPELGAPSRAGKGVEPADFATLVAKHATSKISGFEDIAGVASFGFR